MNKNFGGLVCPLKHIALRAGTPSAGRHPSLAKSDKLESYNSPPGFSEEILPSRVGSAGFHT